MSFHCFLKKSQLVLSILLALLVISCGSDEETNANIDDLPSISLILTPIDSGILISNLTDFGDAVFINIVAVGQKATINKTIPVEDFINDSYQLGDLINGDSYRFFIRGLAENGDWWDFFIDFTLLANKEDQDNGGILIGPNSDGDGRADLMDIDSDGDGLIEIKTAAELDAIRYVPNGIGRKVNIVDGLDIAGCDACYGYELINNLDLSAYIDRIYPNKGWLPIGNCQGASFSAVFEGNNYTISGLAIDRPSQDCVGLFAKADGAEIRNLLIEAVEVIGDNKVGALVGDANGAEIFSSYAITPYISGRDNIGGMIGDGSDAKITSSFAVTGPLIGNNQLGGLMGAVNSNSNISYSYWNKDISLIEGADNAKQTDELQSPMSYSGIYDKWDEPVDGNIEGVWCDSNNDGLISANEQREDNLVWDFGSSFEYPAIRCALLSPAKQRDSY